MSFQQSMFYIFVNIVIIHVAISIDQFGRHHNRSWLDPNILSFITGTDSTPPAGLLNETKDCIDQIQKSSAIASERFSALQLAILCRNRKKWISQSLERGVWSDPSKILTQRQLQFLDHFYTCQNPEECICKNRNCRDIDPHEAIDPLEPIPTAMPLQKFGLRHRPDGQRQKRGSVPSPALPKSFRKEYRRLTDHERNRFHDSINRLKSDTLDNLSKYDLLVLHHTPQQAPGAHWGPAFLPWHRELLKQLELALRTYDRTIAVPYWDSTLDEGLPNPRDSILWTEEFLGNGDGGIVNSGPFKNWTTYHPFANEHKIMRSVGESPFGALYRPSDVDAVMAKNSFDDLTNCVDPFFELLHGTVHLWVGGHMLDVPISPNDPTFFLHHSFVDWIWETFRQKRQSSKFQRENEYPPESKSCTSFHYFNATMSPFPLINSDGLSSSYTDTFYSFEDRPMCFPDKTPIENQCGSPYLICDRKRWRCLSKVKIGGNCTGFENSEEELCHKGKCVEGRCRPIDQQKVREFVSSTARTGTSDADWHRTASAVSSGWNKTQTSQNPSSSSGISDSSSVSSTTSGFSSPMSSLSIQSTTVTQSSACECTCPTSPTATLTTPSSSEFSTSTNDPSDFFVDNHQPNKVTPPNFDELSDDYVWFTITILKGNLHSSIKEPVRDARVIVNGLNYKGEYEGRVSNRFDYPYYTGVTFIRVPNPSRQLGLRTEAKIAVYGPSKRPNDSRLYRCHLHCHFDGPPCDGRVIFDLNGSNNESMDTVIPHSTSPSTVLYQLWKNGEHQTDYFLFLCDDSDAPPTQDFVPKPLPRPETCVFQRYEDFLLIGYAEYVEHNISLTECKYRCREGGSAAEDENGNRLVCGSIMHWEDGGVCVMSSQSRLTKPSLFAHFPREGVFYFDYICNAIEIFEI